MVALEVCELWPKLDCVDGLGSLAVLISTLSSEQGIMLLLRSSVEVERSLLCLSNSTRIIGASVVVIMAMIERGEVGNAPRKVSKIWFGYLETTSRSYSLF